MLELKWRELSDETLDCVVAGAARDGQQAVSTEDSSPVLAEVRPGDDRPVS